MIDPYYKDHPDEDKQQKMDLNVYDEPEENDEDRVFEDATETDDDMPGSTIPRQYTEKEMKKIRELQQHKNDNNDDDGTI